MYNKKLILIALTLTVNFLLLINTVLAQKAPHPAQMTVNTYHAPTAVVAQNKAYMLYELYVTSFMTMPVALSALEVKAGDKTIYTLKDNKPVNFKPKKTKIIYMFIPFNTLSEIPSEITNHFIFTGLFENNETDFPLSIPALTVDKTQPVIIGPPLKGTHWLAASGLSNDSSHRLAALYFDGRPYYPELYGIDFLKVGENGRTFDGDIHQNKSFYCYNQEVLAVADGKIVAIQDGIAENNPHSKLAVQMTEETLPGNYIIIELGNKQFAAYGHLIPGSLRVKVGDQVKRGDVIAKLGNSGNSMEPHLHFQMTQKGVFLNTNPIPYGFDKFTIIPTKLDNAEDDTIFKIVFLHEDIQEYDNQLPLENTLMRFE